MFSPYPQLPYLQRLRAERNAMLSTEYRRAEVALYRLAAEHREAVTDQENLRRALRTAEEQFKEASLEPTEEQLGRRGHAERDPGRWTDADVRERQERRYRNRRDRADAERRRVADELECVAQHVAGHRRELRACWEIHLAGAWRIVHHHARREATYLRSLARRGKNWPDVIELLEPFGPELPEWMSVPPDPKTEEAP
ncbi:hypothetical protein [Actinomadura sp. BRA 177]|uniref:hypothetical protein n=1 Tax=Actinomadura sp. BRA 177 TaxID=2745202 RepID=UPI001595C793|nr:hypothetical protein [Actinomadura sp. BRA 177]NVI91627.1 hypothetical protein [Actinomadura sp. BRA 177]